jgi:hypothetical protein
MADAAAPPPTSVLTPLATLYRFLSPRRKRHLFASLALMVSGAVAELLTIGAVLPFLALLASPDNAERFPNSCPCSRPWAWRGTGLSSSAPR